MDICMALMKNIYAIMDMWYICCIVRNSTILHIFLKYVSIYIALYETYFLSATYKLHSLKFRYTYIK